MVHAAEVGVRREKMRPFLPSVVLTGFQSPGGMLIQAGIFGIGPNSSLNQWTGRDDVSIQLIWQLENFGFGNLARIKRQRGEQSQAIVDLRRTQDMVAEEVTRAQARSSRPPPASSRPIAPSAPASSPSTAPSRACRQTSRFGNVLVPLSRPQEAVYALQLLRVAFDEYFTTVAEYNRAQFELFHALGYPAQELAVEHPPGAIRRSTRRGRVSCPPSATARPRRLDEEFPVFSFQCSARRCRQPRLKTEH